jgi:hypothetical protein
MKLKIKDKIRFFRKGENGKWFEACKGIITGFSCDKAHVPIFAFVKTFQEGELTDVDQLLPIKANCAMIVKY